MKKLRIFSATDRGIGGELNLVIDAVLGIFVISVILGMLYLINNGFKTSIRDYQDSDANQTEALMNNTMQAVTVIPKNLKLYATIAVFVGVIALVGLLIRVISGTGGSGGITA